LLRIGFQKLPGPGRIVGAPIPGTPLPRVKHSGGFPVITVIVTGMLALFGFLGYQILKDKEEPVAKAVTVPVPAPPKPKSKPAPPKPEPVVVAPEPEPGVETASAFFYVIPYVGFRVIGIFVQQFFRKFPLGQ